MPTRYDADDEDPDSEGGDREISLGTGTVLAIFLALALVCSLFFGLGYSMGRKSAPPQTASTPVTEASGLTASGAEKPSSGSPASYRSLATASQSDLQVTQPIEPDAQPTEAVSESGTVAGRHSASHDHSSASRPESPATPPAVGASGQQIFVQIAAVSRKEDADLLLAALRKRGYAGVIRPQTQDRLLHIQVGPFPAKKDAEAMRQRLIVDGYNPILK